MSGRVPRAAMVLAAGLGMRMRPLTETTPKPLIAIGGRPMIDWALDALAAAGVARAVVNVHHLAAKVEAHLAERADPRITISDERERLLDSAGGIAKALDLLGKDPFFVVNADTFWIDRDRSNLERLALAWYAGRMDILLMLADRESAIGHSGGADFVMDGDGRLARAPKGADGFVYAGAAIIDPAVFTGAPREPHSLNLHFDRAIASGRLFGMPLDGTWITVGTPDAIAPAEAAVAHARSAPA